MDTKSRSNRRTDAIFELIRKQYPGHAQEHHETIYIPVDGSTSLTFTSGAAGESAFFTRLQRYPLLAVYDVSPLHFNGPSENDAVEVRDPTDNYSKIMTISDHDIPSPDPIPDSVAIQNIRFCAGY